MRLKRTSMKALLSLFTFLFFAAFAATAKDGFSLSGRVVNSTGKALSGANILLLTDSNKMVKAEVTDATGSFSFSDLGVGNYLLKATLPGMTDYTSEAVSLTETKVLPDISLSPAATSLQEVAVRAQKPFIEVKADKIVVNVEASISSAGSSVLDVLRRSPGVTVNQNDALSLKGKQGVLVMIDGKLTPMAGENLTNMLKSMSAESIGQIELISNPSAKYDAAGTAGIINIKTKRDKRAGVNGSVNAFYGQGVSQNGCWRTIQLSQREGDAQCVLQLQLPKWL